MVLSYNVGSKREYAPLHFGRSKANGHPAGKYASRDLGILHAYFIRNNMGGSRGGGSWGSNFIKRGKKNILHVRANAPRFSS